MENVVVQWSDAYVPVSKWGIQHARTTYIGLSLITVHLRTEEAFLDKHVSKNNSNVLFFSDTLPRLSEKYA